MFTRRTDRSWEYFGRNDPYFGVITYDEFRKSNLTNENKGEFFRLGSEYVAQVLESVRTHFDPNFSIKHGLDFGCGVGRLLIPLAQVAEKITGTDISASMLAEASGNLKKRSITNVDLIHADKFSRCTHKYDFIHSFMVFQHIPVRRGKNLFRNLLDHLVDGGVCVMHFTYDRSPKSKLVSFLKDYIPFAQTLMNAIRRRSLATSAMQMHTYHLNSVFRLIQGLRVQNVYAEFTDHGGVLGVLLYFRKPRQSLME